MYEAMTLLNTPDFKDRILPITLSSANIHDPIARLTYLAYWESKIATIEAKVREQTSIGFSDSVISDLNKYKKIRDSIDEFLSYLQGHKHFSFDAIKAQHYAPIKEILEISDGEEPEMSLRELNAYINGRELERKRIAMYLHDDVGAFLSIIQLNLAIEKDTDKKLQKVSELVSKLRDDVRGLVYNISNNTLYWSGLIKAVEVLIASVDDSNSDLKVNLIHNDFKARFETEIEEKVYGVVQELLNNVIKHAQASHCDIQILFSKTALHIQVGDDGIGFDPERSNDRLKSGLRNVEARLHNLGQITFESNKGAGTLVDVEIPINKLKVRE